MVENGPSKKAQSEVYEIDWVFCLALATSQRKGFDKVLAFRVAMPAEALVKFFLGEIGS